jgi:hypothetical protein
MMREITITTAWFIKHGIDLGELTDEDFERGVMLRVKNRHGRTGWQYLTFDKSGEQPKVEWRSIYDTREKALNAPVETTTSVERMA